MEVYVPEEYDSYSYIVKWLSVSFLHYRYEADKSTKFCMNLPKVILIKISLGALMDFLPTIDEG